MTMLLLAAELFDGFDLDWIFYGLMGLIGSVYIGFPLLIMSQQKFEAEPRMIRFDPEQYEWPPEIDRLFTESVESLEQVGFKAVDHLFLPSVVENVKTAVILMVNHAEIDNAMVTAMYAQPVQPGSLRTLYVEFSSKFDDGYEYNTNNSTQLNAFPTPDNTTTNQFVKIKDPQSLYEVHQAILSRDGRSRSQKVQRLETEFNGDAAEYLAQAMGEEFESAAEFNYVKRQGDQYVLTPRGAFLMVWKELWPWKMVRKINRDQNAKTLLGELSREGVNIDSLS